MPCLEAWCDEHNAQLSTLNSVILWRHPRRHGTWSARWRLPDGWQEAMPEVAEWYDQTTDTGQTVEITDLLDRTAIEATESERDN
jgi:hypothetical protein